MNGIGAALDELNALIALHPDPVVDLLICPPATLLNQSAQLAADSPLDIGGQDCHTETQGAHTGDISGPMLADAGATHVILGHSERRENHDETSELTREKAKTAQSAGLTTIICLGESLAQREAENTLDIIAGQLSLSVPDASTAENTVIAYEPIWAIGTGLTPSVEQIDEVHDFIRTRLIARFGADIGNGIRLLYGGSVKPDNAAEIFATDNVDGALVGGASLKASDFSPIITALEASA